jgi:hypothetical protein
VIGLRSSSATPLFIIVSAAVLTTSTQAYHCSYCGILKSVNIGSDCHKLLADTALDKNRAAKNKKAASPPEGELAAK